MNNNYYNQNPYGNYYGQPMSYVNGLEGAKAYWMGTNQIAYLRDNNDDTLMYEKRTDNFGKYQMKAYKLTELKVDSSTNTFKQPNSEEGINILNSKLDAIYAILAPKNEVKANEQQ